MSKSVGQVPTAGEQTQQKPCRKSSDIGAELENRTVGRGPMEDRKELTVLHYDEMRSDMAVAVNCHTCFLNWY
jgi:hypothetical protein